MDGAITSVNHQYKVAGIRAEKTISVVLWGRYTNFRAPNTIKAVLYYFKRFSVSKYRTFMSRCVKFYYRHKDLAELFHFFMEGTLSYMVQ